jgi:hypothetical protein
MYGVCEAEANKELPISVAAAASAVLDATFLVKGEHVVRFRPEGIGRQGQLNNVRIVPLVRPRGDFSFAPIHAYALIINPARGDGPVFLPGCGNLACPFSPPYNPIITQRWSAQCEQERHRNKYGFHDEFLSQVGTRA